MIVFLEITRSSSSRSRSPVFINSTILLPSNRIILGSIPQRIKNRVNAEQPLLAGRIRKHCERRYEIRDPDVDGITILEKIKCVPSLFEEPPTPRPVTTSVGENKTPSEHTKKDPIAEMDTTSATAAVSSTPHSSRKSTGESQESFQSADEKQSSGFVLDNGFDLKENHYTKSTRDGGKVELPPRRMTSEDSLMNDSESIGDFSQVEVMFSLSRISKEIEKTIVDFL